MKQYFVRTLLLAMSILLMGCGGGGNENASTGTVALAISGTPTPSVRQGEAFQFTPTTLGTGLTFSIQNKPDWMSFDSTSGQLSGTPTSADVGVYTDIRISVTNGDIRATLGDFNITVKSASVILSWTAPTTRADGTVLDMTEIGGYKVYTGSSVTDLTLVANVSDPYTMKYEFNALGEGIHYFAVSAYNTSGVESSMSVVVSKTI